MSHSHLEHNRLMQYWQLHVLHGRRVFSASLRLVANTGMSLREMGRDKLTCPIAREEP